VQQRRAAPPSLAQQAARLNAAHRLLPERIHSDIRNIIPGSGVLHDWRYFVWVIGRIWLIDTRWPASLRRDSPTRV